MTNLIDGGSDFGTNDSTAMQRRELLRQLQDGLPKAGQIGDSEGSPEERRIALAKLFLLYMSRGETATASMMKDHAAYSSRGLNYIGHTCKKIGLQWESVGGRKVYPPTGANMLRLCYFLNEIAPVGLEQIGGYLGMSVDGLIDHARRKYEEESVEPRDEFVDRPEDFQHSTPPGSHAPVDEIQAMLDEYDPPLADETKPPVSTPTVSDSAAVSSEEEELDSPSRVGLSPEQPLE